MDDLALPAHHLTREMVEKEGFADLPLSLANDAVPPLLLGLDNAELLASIKMAMGKSRGVVATRTKLGWVIMGQVGQAKAARCLFVREDRRLEELVEQYIEADDFRLVEDAPRTYEMQVMVFGAACSPTLAQYAKNVDAARFAYEFPEAAKAIVEQHYVDDYLDSHETAERALQVAQEVKHIHQRGCFCITKLVSNDKAVTRALGGDEEQVIEVSSTGTLGLDWDTSNDCFSFRGRVAKMRKEFAAGRLQTKRQILRMAMSLFDPLGMVAYITVVARILLREAWRSETEWDQQIPISCIRAWEEWVECLEGVHNIPIPRWYGELGVAVELHMFVDASESAIGAVVYAVNRRGPGDATVAMVMAKCRVAPLRTKSIPRLELDAAVLGVRSLGIVVAAKCWDVE